MTEQTQELITVSEFARRRGVPPQIVHGEIRNQGAPFEEKDGKRMINVSVYNEWLTQKQQRKAEGKGTTKAESIQRKTNLKPGTLMMYTTGVDNRIAVAKADKISSYLVWADTSMRRRDKTYAQRFQIPFGWEALVKKLRKGELALVNPHIVIDLLIGHYEHAGAAEHEIELELLRQLKLLADPETSPEIEIELPESEDMDEDTNEEEEQRMTS